MDSCSRARQTSRRQGADTLFQRVHFSMWPRRAGRAARIVDSLDEDDLFLDSWRIIYCSARHRYHRVAYPRRTVLRRIRREFERVI